VSIPQKPWSRRLVTSTAAFAAGAAVVAGSALPAAADGPPTGFQLSASCENNSPAQWADWTTTPLRLTAGQDNPLQQQVCELDYFNYTSTDFQNLTTTLTLTPQSVAATGFTAQQLSQRLLVQVGTQSTKLDPVSASWTVGSDGSLSVAVPDSIDSAPGSGGGGIRFFFVGAPTMTSALLKGTLAVSQPDGTSVGSLAVSIDYVADGKTYTPGTPSTYVTTTPARLADVSSVGAGHVVAVPVAGVDGVPASGVTAVVLNVTAADGAKGGFVTAYADGRARPGVSSLNYAPGQAVANEVTVPVVDGKVDLYASAGPVTLIADVNGYYSAQGSRFVPSGPTRIVDSRVGLGFPKSGIDGQTLTPASWANGIPSVGVTAVDLNVTVTNEAGSGFIQMYPASSTEPATSNLDYTRDDTVANHVQVSTESYGQVFVVNRGTHDIAMIVDLDGYFTD
jgi:hypothetical protein